MFIRIIYTVKKFKKQKEIDFVIITIILITDYNRHVRR